MSDISDHTLFYQFFVSPYTVPLVLLWFSMVQCCNNTNCRIENEYPQSKLHVEGHVAAATLVDFLPGPCGLTKIMKENHHCHWLPGRDSGRRVQAFRRASTKPTLKRKWNKRLMVFFMRGKRRNRNSNFRKMRRLSERRKLDMGPRWQTDQTG